MAKVAPIVVVIAVQFFLGSSDRSSCSYDDGSLLVKGNVLKFPFEMTSHLKTYEYFVKDPNGL